VAADRRPVVFLHVMKCGGMSVRAALAAAAGDDRVFELDGHASKTAIGDPLGDDWAFRDALLVYELAAHRPAVIMGHFRHRDRYASLVDVAHFVTVLRDPVDRLVSLYRYRRFGDGIDLPQPRSLEELLASGRWDLEGHRYVSTFVGRDDVDPRSEAAIDAAVTNLRTFAAVGRSDRLERFAHDLSKLIGRDVTMPRLNPSPAPEPTAEVDENLRGRLAALCAPDLALYQAMFGSS
jgi:hypothetical protein